MRTSWSIAVGQAREASPRRRGEHLQSPVRANPRAPLQSAGRAGHPRVRARARAAGPAIRGRDGRAAVQRISEDAARGAGAGSGSPRRSPIAGPTHRSAGRGPRCRPRAQARAARARTGSSSAPHVGADWAQNRPVRVSWAPERPFTHRAPVWRHTGAYATSPPGGQDPTDSGPGAVDAGAQPRCENRGRTGG